MIKTLYPTFQRWSENGSVYLISDTHFDDDDCKIMSSDWINPKDHIEIIKRARKSDTLVHLGDVGNPEYLKEIKAHKVLIMGNHDESAARFIDYFDEVYTGPLMIAEKIILSHEPVMVPWAYNIHGHDHNPKNKGSRFDLNIAANVVGYKLTNLKDVINSGALKNIKSIHRITIDNAKNNSRSSHIHTHKR